MVSHLYVQNGGISGVKMNKVLLLGVFFFFFFYSESKLLLNHSSSFFKVSVLFFSKSIGLEIVISTRVSSAKSMG